MAMTKWQLHRHTLLGAVRQEAIGCLSNKSSTVLLKMRMMGAEVFSVWGGRGDCAKTWGVAGTQEHHALSVHTLGTKSWLLMENRGKRCLCLQEQRPVWSQPQSDFCVVFASTNIVRVRHSMLFRLFMWFHYVLYNIYKDFGGFHA